MIQHIWCKCVFIHIWFYLFAYTCKYKDILQSIHFSIFLYPPVLKMTSSYRSLQFHSSAMGFILASFPRMYLLSLVMRSLTLQILNSPTHSLKLRMWTLSLPLPSAPWTLTVLRLRHPVPGCPHSMDTCFLCSGSNALSWATSCLDTLHALSGLWQSVLGGPGKDAQLHLWPACGAAILGGHALAGSELWHPALGH